MSAKEEKKNIIIENSLKLFSKKGFYNTTIPDIAKSMKMSVGNMYNYFKSKEELAKFAIKYSTNVLAVELKEINQMDISSKEKIFVLSGGSNTLITDNTYDGVVIKLSDNFSNMSLLPNDIIVAGSAVGDKSLSEYAMSHNLGGFETSNLGRFFIVFLVIVSCGLTLLWSRLDLNETRVALGHAQRDYQAALEEHQRLQIELSVLTSPTSVQQQIKAWELETNNNVIEIFEATKE